MSSPMYVEDPVAVEAVGFAGTEEDHDGSVNQQSHCKSFLGYKCGHVRSRYSEIE